LMVGLSITYCITIVALMIWYRRTLKQTCQQEVADNRPSLLAAPLFEYRSKLALFDLPLVHIRLRGGLERGPVKAWIAAGDSAIGVIFAFGGLAIAPISFGGFAVGLLALGGFAIGLVTFGGFSLGPWAIGGMVVGGQAFGGCAIAWLGAQGGMAVAHDFALGGVALARHANDAVAEAFFTNSVFFRTAQVAMRYTGWLYLFCLFPLILWWWNGRQLRRKNQEL